MTRSANYRDVVESVMAAARDADYAGYSKFDALNSPLLDKLSLQTRVGRFLLTQLVKECPLNVRPLLGVRPSRNPKGIALFARTCLLLHQATGDAAWLAEAEGLLQWLLANPSADQPHLCWGYNYVWQSTLFLQDRFEPNAVVTVFVGEALVHAYAVTANSAYLEAAVSVAEFIARDLPVLVDESDERAIAYVLRTVRAVVLNNQVLTGALLAKVGQLTGEAHYTALARRQLTYTWRRRTDYACWYYTHPRGKSPITHDNYHTGGILDGFLEYWETTGDDQFQAVYWQGLDYYEQHLFEADGAPRWMNGKRYPHDIHGAAQGVITFAKAAAHRPVHLAQAERIADWAMAHLYRPRTRDFAYRQGRLMKWDYSLMRWCNGWMSRALAEVVCYQAKQDVDDR